MIIKSKDNDTMIFTESGVSLRIQSSLDAYGEEKYRIVADTGLNGLNMGFLDTEEEAMMVLDNIEKSYYAPQQNYNSMCKIVDEAWQEMANKEDREKS